MTSVPLTLTVIKMRSFQFKAFPTCVVFGTDTLPNVVHQAASLDFTRVLVIASPAQEALAHHVSDILQKHVTVVVYAGAQMHTPVEATEKAMKAVRSNNIDGLIAVGGGSAIGLSKAIAYRTGLAQLAIPTTYAGSEATSILGQTENGVKTTLKDAKVAIKTIVYDVNLTKTLPVQFSVTSGFNAMAHAVEAL